MTNKFAIVSLMAVVFFLAPAGIALAEITWGPAQNTSGPGDVSTNGALNEAINMVAGPSMMPGSTTVNGVTFTNDDTLLPLTYSANMLAGNSSGDAGYDALIGYLDYGGGSAYSIEAGSGLTVGREYEIQLWYTDLRGYGDFKMGFDDGNGNKVILDSDSGGLGQFVIGTFTADASTLTVYISTGPSGSGPPAECHLNAYQIRREPCEPIGTVVELDNPMQVREADVNGSAVAFSVVLGIEPGATDTITVDVDPDSNGNGIDITVNPAQLTFTSADWDTPQTVTVKAIDDTVQDHGESRTDIIDFTVTSAESDSRYADGCPLDTVSVTIVGNDLGCGDWGYLPEDLNLDCYVDLADFAKFALYYLDGV